ncbi:MAG: molybdenum cofactor biosynthesis protein MoaA, partial [Candidatus Korarchaeum sp.]
CEEEFSLLTGAKPEAFELQLRALENLADEGVSAHPAVMLSFSSGESIRKLFRRIEEIEPAYLRRFEEEYVFLYPHVKERLRRAGVTPKMAYEPESIPEELR